MGSNGNISTNEPLAEAQQRDGCYAVGLARGLSVAVLMQIWNAKSEVERRAILARYSKK